MHTNELPVIQKTYDLIKWYIPVINRLPNSHKFGLGDKIVDVLYSLLENLILAKYDQNKIDILEHSNAKIDILRHQTRLLLDFKLIEDNRYQYASRLIYDIGTDIGAWLKHQKRQPLSV